VAGFDVGDVSRRASNEPLGAVIDSRPRPGNQAPMPSAVALIVSAGPTMIVVPDISGRSLSDARLLLQQVGLSVGDVMWGATGASVADAAAVVVSQSPPAGSQVTAGSKVNVSLGTRTP
jgi:serine/threonine-protein kinase